VIRHHLAMVRFWQKNDIDDPRSIEQFAALTEDVDQLRYLYVHTYCDARGTATDLWNGYKDSLHTSLYRRTVEFLESGTPVEDRVAARRVALLAEVPQATAQGPTVDAVAVHLSQLPDRYYMQTDVAEVRVHVRMVNALLAMIVSEDAAGSLQPVIEWHDDVNRGFSVVHIATWDRLGLFFRLSGAFSVAGLNILSARAFSRSDHIAIDTFQVMEPGYGIVQSSEVKETFSRTLNAALVENTNLLPDILRQAGRIRLSRFASEQRKLQSHLPPRVEKTAVKFP
jgi:[protein-PII] uridylyltransferase